MTKIIDFKTGDDIDDSTANAIAYCQEDGARVEFKSYKADMSDKGAQAMTLSFEDYKMICLDDLIDLCETVEKVKIVKSIFESVECSLFGEAEIL